MIPKIIHQTWKTEELPESFRILTENTKSLHPSWEYVLWTDEMNQNFIYKNYPNFLSHFNSYSTNIQRADAIRYFILYHYGGIYLDLDFEIFKSLDTIIKKRNCIFGLEPKAHSDRFKMEKIVCNAFMASSKNNRFFKNICTKLTQSVLTDNIDKLDILNSTGPFFLTKVYENYDQKTEITILPSAFFYPLTIGEVRLASAGEISKNMEVSLQQAYGIHLFWGSWWSECKI